MTTLDRERAVAGMRPEDVYELTGVVDPRLSPDARTVAYAVWAVDREANEYTSAIFVAPLDGSEPPRELAPSGKEDAAAIWSPDGTRIAFVSNRDHKEKQLYVVDAAGGHPVPLTELAEEVQTPVWSPDGTRLAFAARVRDREYEEEDEKRRAPRRITRLQFKYDDVGWTTDRRRHVFTVAADGSAPPVQLTDGDFEDAHPAWSPDGAMLAFDSARHADWDTDIARDVYVVGADGGDPRRVTAGEGECAAPVWSPDGTRIAFRYTPLGPDGWDYPRHGQIAVVPADGGELRILTASLDRNCAPYPDIREPIWDGAEIVFALEDRGSTHVYGVRDDGSEEPELRIGGELNVTGYDAVGGVLVDTRTTATTLPELHHGDERLTEATRRFAETHEPADAERFAATSTGGVEVEAWIVRPPRLEPGARCPLLVSIHGGPFAQYGNRFFDEFQVYAGAGYAVVYCNPRGSSGYGEEWARAIRGPSNGGPGWGSLDYDDVIAVTDEALRRFDFCDPDRVGVLGGSYGGYLTSWIVSHTDRFKAACSERSVNNLVADWGSSDTGWMWKAYLGSYVFEDFDAYVRHSPSTYAENIRTPLLIMHSENDLRCPVEQAEDLFTTLRVLKREVELVRFPAESHELSRSGSPVHRVMRHEIILDWFRRYLR